MSYSLSAQLAAMALDIEAGFVNEYALIDVSGFEDLLGSDFELNGTSVVSVRALMEEANDALLTSDQEYLEALKSLLDRANNNVNFYPL